MTNLDVASLYRDKSEKILRINVSDVSAVSGYHPWRSPLDLFNQYLYQDIPRLLDVDCRNLSIEITTKEQEILSLFQKLKKDSQSAVEIIRNQVKISDSVSASSKAENILKCLSNELNKNKTGLSEREYTVLLDELSGEVRTGIFAYY